MANDQLFSDNAQATLTEDLLPGDLVISNIAASQASLFGASSIATGDYQIATITDGINYEIIKITERGVDSLTVIRAQQGTSAIGVSTGSFVFAGLTAADVASMKTGNPPISGAGTPVGSVTPGYLSQKYLDTTNDLEYTANGLTSSDWILITNHSVLNAGGDPNGVLTPEFAGQICLVPSGKEIYIAGGTANTEWIKAFPIYPNTPVVLADLVASGTATIDMNVTTEAYLVVVTGNSTTINFTLPTDQAVTCHTDVIVGYSGGTNAPAIQVGGNAITPSGTGTAVGDSQILRVKFYAAYNTITPMTAEWIDHTVEIDRFGALV